MRDTGVVLKLRAPLDPALRSKAYHAIHCARCAVVIGRIPHIVAKGEHDARIHMAKAAHVRECRAVESGAWVLDSNDHSSRIARRDTPMIVARTERRGVAWRWTVRVGSGARFAGTGYQPDRPAAQKAADECVRAIVAGGR